VCVAPLPARRIAGGQIEFLAHDGRNRGRYQSAPLQIPCGQCVECRLKRSREWAVRCMHESSLHNDNCFLTLTYRDLPDKTAPPGAVSLDYSHVQGFLKRLRARYPLDKILFFCCGGMIFICRFLRCSASSRF